MKIYGNVGNDEDEDAATEGSIQARQLQQSWHEQKPDGPHEVVTLDGDTVAPFAEQ